MSSCFSGSRKPPRHEGGYPNAISRTSGRLRSFCLAHWSLGLLLRPPMGLLRAKPVYALNADRSEHRSAYAATLCPVAAHRAPSLQEGILYEILGVVRIASHSLRASE
jgi:hypothetical protein